MSLHNVPVQRSQTSSLNSAPARANFMQRKCACGNQSVAGGECSACAQTKSALQHKQMREADNTAPPIVDEVLRTAGQSLDAATLAYMEPRFGRNFTRVRVHDDVRAAESARAVNAQAYAVGHDIVFDSGRYEPESLEGRQLIAHELAHVAQQRDAPEFMSGGVVIAESPAHEAEADRAAGALVSGAQPVAPQTTPAMSGLQRLENDADVSGDATASGSETRAASASCIEAVVNEDPTTLTEAGTVTIVEFGAEWCKPCKMLKASLEEMCQTFKVQPPKAPVRIFSIDIDAEGNEEIARRYTDKNVPHIYFYVSGQQKAHYADALQPDVLEALVSEYSDEASQSEAWKGFKSGAKWGGLIGAGLGVLGAVGIGLWGNLDGNALMGAIGGSVLGGAAAGVLLAGGAGAAIGAATEEKKGSRRKKKRPQAKQRTGVAREPEELEADAMAAQVAQQFNGSKIEVQSALVPSGAPMEAPLRLEMESRFGRDFSQVRLHHDSAASRIAESMQAYAVTDGPNIYFAADGYAPYTPGGRAILAHELTHVVQQDMTGSEAPIASLESEATQASVDIARSHPIQVQQKAGSTPLPITRGQQTALGATIGAGAGAAVGALIGLGVAAAMPGSPYGLGAGIGAAIGGGARIRCRRPISAVSRRSSRVGAQEADALIRRRYGRYLPDGVPPPLRDAVVRPVSSSELCERFRCRHQPDDKCNMIGWTDTGVPWRAAAPPEETITSQSDEPTCNGKQMEHATPEHPVIYFQNDTDDAGILVHEGLHAMAHPEFQRLHNYVNEGATEWFTRQLLVDVNIAPSKGYDENVVDVSRFIDIVGEESFARAYFGGDLAGLDRATTAILGPCALMEWAIALQLKDFDNQKPDRIIESRHVDYCKNVTQRAPAAAGAPGKEKAELGGTGGHHV